MKWADLVLAEDILRALPHRYPFLAVDRVLDVVPGKKAVALKAVAVGAPFTGVSGPGLSPEVMVLEAMAQVGALAYALLPEAAQSAADGQAGVGGYLAGLNDVVFHERPKAGDMLELTLEFVAAMGPMSRFRGTARISGKLAVEAGLTFTVERRK